MSGAFARNKGQRAERAFIKELQPIIDQVYAKYPEMEIPKLERNLMQTMKGGFDIVGLDWLALEIKHQETLKINDWWSQTKQQAGEDKIPVLAYKKNNVKWRIVMFGTLPVGPRRIRCPVDISIESFFVYFEQQLEYYLGILIQD